MCAAVSVTFIILIMCILIYAINNSPICADGE